MVTSDRVNQPPNGCLIGHTEMCLSPWKLAGVKHRSDINRTWMLGLLEARDFFDETEVIDT